MNQFHVRIVLAGNQARKRVAGLAGESKPPPWGYRAEENMRRKPAQYIRRSYRAERVARGDAKWRAAESADSGAVPGHEFSGKVTRGLSGARHLARF
jgi:hypothetical protein